MAERFTDLSNREEGSARQKVPVDAPIGLAAINEDERKVEAEELKRR
jgi:hypothetical protein